MNERQAEAIVVFITTNKPEEANRLAEILIERRLAACVQILPQITSVYHWQGAVARDEEILILVKTTSEQFAALEQAIRENHSYTTPEIVAVPASNVSAPYLNWLKETVGERGDQ